MSRRTREGIGSALCFVAVLAALIAIDARVRERFRSLFEDTSSGRVASWADRLGSLGTAIAQAVHDQSIEHAPLLLFVAVAVILVLFMLRT